MACVSIQWPTKAIPPGTRFNCNQPPNGRSRVICERTWNVKARITCAKSTLLTLVNATQKLCWTSPFVKVNFEIIYSILRCNHFGKQSVNLRSCCGPPLLSERERERNYAIGRNRLTRFRLSGIFIESSRQLLRCHYRTLSDMSQVMQCEQNCPCINMPLHLAYNQIFALSVHPKLALND